MKLKLIGLTLFIAAAAFAQETAPVTFEDLSASIDFERVSRPFDGDGVAGVAWFDYNNDGNQDVFVTGGRNQINGLFQNNGDGTFTNVIADSGLAGGQGNGGVTIADIDNDGWQDMLLTGDNNTLLGNGPLGGQLMRNKGDGTFEDITVSSGVAVPGTALSASFGDINNDGYLDLFITGAGSVPNGYWERNKLYLNNGDLTFTDISFLSGIDSYKGACVSLFTDYDNDGDIDLIVGDCNDYGLRFTPIELFRNNGNMTFTEVSKEAGLWNTGYWMGIDSADYDNDGDLDLYLTNLGSVDPLDGTPHALFRNNGDGTYTDVSVQAGVDRWEFGWGCSFKDFDNDGYADIYAVGALPGFVMDIICPEMASPGRLFFNNGDGTFRDMTHTSPVDLSETFTSGLATGDLDNDGFHDMIVAADAFEEGRSGKPILLRNKGNDNNYVRLTLQGVHSNRDGVGSKIKVTTGDMTQLKEVYAGSSFLSTDSKTQIFGIAAATATDRIEVTWPSGRLETFPNMQAGEHALLVEGTGENILRPRLNFPWVSDNDQFKSTLIVSNGSDRAVTVHFQATRADKTQSSAQHTIPANGFIKHEASELFDDMSGSGYSVVLYADHEMVHGSWVTRSLESANGTSPSQGTAVNIDTRSASPGIGQKLHFGFLPNTDGSISAPVVVNTGDAPVDVTLHFYDATGALIATDSDSIKALAPHVPFATVTGSKVPENAGDVYMTATTAGGSITGSVFIFNEAREPSIGSVTVIR